MKKDNTEIMELNRETAMRLWNKQFGKKTKVKDFAGREIVKGAYDQRTSDYGWNVDHILPQSKGGKTADYNLICCHIQTNDEKANKFPCFTANNTKFEIRKVENHYEIKLANDTKKLEEDEPEVNLYDSASGIRFFKKLNGIQNQHRYVGTVLIRLMNVNNTAVIDFIEKFFDEENLSYKLEEKYYHSETRILIKNYNMPLMEDDAKLLDKCILLNTYLCHYFLGIKCVSSYDIYYRSDYYQEKQQMYVDTQNFNLNNISIHHVQRKRTIEYLEMYPNPLVNYYGINELNNSLYINKLAYSNTEAHDREPNLDFDHHEYCAYNYCFTKLAKNLDKEVGE